MIGLTPSDESRRDLADFLRRLDDLGDPSSAAVASVQTAIRAGFAAMFDSEGAAGAAPWAELAEATKRERQRLGFPPAHPILLRTGDYRASFVNEGHADHVSEWSADGGVWRIAEGSRHELAQYHEPGTERMPARPVTVLGPAVEAQIGAVLEQLFREWFGYGQSST